MVYVYRARALQVAEGEVGEAAWRVMQEFARHEIYYEEGVRHFGDDREFIRVVWGTCNIEATNAHGEVCISAAFGRKDAAVAERFFTAVSSLRLTWTAEVRVPLLVPRGQHEEEVSLHGVPALLLLALARQWRQELGDRVR